ncbi:MAG: hypothetical protein OEU54_05190 [Gemmatimonadota bacterium]|nr:hypothetical protein [Gemmatimonadota bacterium]
MRRRWVTSILAGAIACSPAVAQEVEQDHAAMDHAAMGHETGEVIDESAPPELPIVNDLLRIAHDQENRVVEVIVGPVSLPAASGHLRTPIQMIELGIEGWMHGFSWEMRDAAGDVLPERLLHHVNLIDPDSRELFSPIARRIMAAGRETKGEGVPGLLGYPLQPGNRVLVNAMFASLPDAGYDEAYLHISLPYTPADDPGFIRPRNVYPFYLDVMGPVGDKEFALPPGTHGRTWEGRPAVSGRLLALGGHLHDYGDWIRLEDLTTGKILWEGKPVMGDGGAVESVPTGKLWWRGGARIDADHTYRISVQYTNPLDVPAPDAAMGAIGGVILSNDARWPEFDRDDPDYLEDLRNTLNKPNESHEHGAAAMDAAEPATGDDGHEHTTGSAGASDPS